MAMSSPWAMLITPMRPNTMASPSAIRASTVNRLSPLKACMTTMSRLMTGRRASDLRKRVGLDQRRLVDHFDLTVLLEGPDARVLPQMMIGFVELDLALWRVDLEIGRGRHDRGHLEALGLLGRHLPEIHGDVAALEGVAHHPIRPVLGLEGLHELVVGSALEALEVAHAGEEALEVLHADARGLFFGHGEGEKRLVLAVEAGRLELLVERHVAPADHGGQDHFRLLRLDLVDHRGELDIAQRDVVLAEHLDASLLNGRLGDLVGRAGPDVVGADQIEGLALVFCKSVDGGDHVLSFLTRRSPPT